MQLSVLSNFVKGMEGVSIDPRLDPEIEGLALDSRLVKQGYLFAALSGVQAQGVDYIRDAVANGAVSLLVPPHTELPEEAKDLAVIGAEDPHRILSLLAAHFYGAQPEHVVAVTGTNGKTSTAHFTRLLWEHCGMNAASMGTLGVQGGGHDRQWSMTTPDAITLQAELALLAKQGITHLAMEASSHGLQQARMDGVRIGAAGFTNLTRDHLDYHTDMADYLKAKTRLFDSFLQKGDIAVLNADIEPFDMLSSLCKRRGITVWGYGMRGQEFCLKDRVPTRGGQDVTIEVFGVTHRLRLPLVGHFQAMNALCALGLAMASGRDDRLIAGMEKLQGAAGRLQHIAGPVADSAIYIDYAHTPDALENILTALRPHVAGRLICLFGCGGDRDAGKRPIMGEIATRLADMVVITDDNPRSEDPEKIRLAIAAGAGPDAILVDGRRKAIAWAVKEIRQGDILVLAGKGHEQGQIFANHVDPFDDGEEVRKAMIQQAGKIE